MFRFPVLRTVGRGGVFWVCSSAYLWKITSPPTRFLKKKEIPCINFSRGEFWWEKRSANAYKFGDILKKGGAFLLGVN